MEMAHKKALMMIICQNVVFGLTLSSLSGRMATASIWLINTGSRLMINSFQANELYYSLALSSSTKSMITIFASEVTTIDYL